MYKLINEHVETIVAYTDMKDKMIKPYLDLRKWLYERNVSQDRELQTKYKGYWVMGRLGDDFYRHYFKLLEQRKCGGNPDVGTVVRKLCKTPVNSKGVYRIQFSFASKLVHMCQPTMPIYDSMIKEFFFLPNADKKKGDDKLDELKMSYDFLIKEYARVIKHNMLGEAMSKVRALCESPADLTDQRVIDLLIWAFVKWAHSGGIQLCIARYS